MSQTDLAHLLDVSHEALAITGFVCIHIAIADQMDTENEWRETTSQERLDEHRRRHEAILTKQMQCPAWDTCTNRIETTQRKDKQPEPERKVTELQQRRFEAFKGHRVG